MRGSRFVIVDEVDVVDGIRDDVDCGRVVDAREPRADGGREDVGAAMK